MNTNMYAIHDQRGNYAINQHGKFHKVKEDDFPFIFGGFSDQTIFQDKRIADAYLEEMKKRFDWADKLVLMTLNISDSDKYYSARLPDDF